MNKVSELLKYLEIVIQDSKHNRQVVNDVKDRMFRLHGVLRGEVQQIFMGNIKLEELDKKTLINFSNELKEVTKVSIINPDRYFTDKEINKAESSNSLSEVSDLDFPIVLHNVSEIEDDTFSLIIDGNILVRLYNSNLLEYNYEISKKYKLVANKEGKLIQTIDINLREVKKVADQIISGEYSIDKVVLNVLKGSGVNGKEVEYNNNTLVIHESQIDIVDGLQDINALAYVYEEQPDKKVEIKLEIKHYDLPSIKQYFNKLNVKGGVN